MGNIAQVTAEKAPADLKQIYEQVKKKMGKIPNMFMHMGNSTPVLLAYFLESDLATKTSIPAPLREAIDLVVSQSNECNYCLSAHSAIAKMQGFDDQKISQSRKGEAKDPKEKAILQFAKKIVEKKGKLSSQELEDLKKAGVNDREIVEIIFLVHVTMFTNYFNHIIDPDVDFPEAPKLV